MEERKRFYRQKLMELFFPENNVCHLCGRWSNGLPFCEDCLTGMNSCLFKDSRFLHSPLTLCAAPWQHTAHARQAVHLLKYASDRASACLLAEGMSMAIVHQPCLQQVDALVPVPLHPEREKDRGYNQSMWLAEEISEHTGIPVASDLLIRIRDTRTQVHHNRQQRLAAMVGAFAVARGKDVAGKKLLLVDDVFTTGATMTACAHALLASGAEYVYGVTACRA